MTGFAEEAIRARRKQAIRWAAGAFAGALLLLTFFSNTYQQLTLPKVSFEKPRVSQLSYEIEGKGAIRPKRTVSLYDQSGWPVREVRVKEGDVVQKGQPLLALDASAAVRSLADEEDRYAKQQLDMERLQEALKLAGVRGEADNMDELKRQLAALQLDMSIQSRKIAHISEEIAEKSVLKAPFDGAIVELQADEGLPASPGKAVIQLSDLSRGWELLTRIDADSAARLATGEELDVRIKTAEPRYVKGIVAAIEEAEPGSQQQGGGAEAMKQVTVDIGDPQLSGGEQAEFHISRKVGMPRLLVPKAAVKTDSQGEYLFTVEETKRPLGNEFRVIKKYVHTEDTDETNAALRGMVGADEKIVTESSEPISDGDRVRLSE